MLSVNLVEHSPPKNDTLLQRRWARVPKGTPLSCLAVIHAQYSAQHEFKAVRF
jgi:hypothetical protein